MILAPPTGKLMAESTKELLWEMVMKSTNEHSYCYILNPNQTTYGHINYWHFINHVHFKCHWKKRSIWILYANCIHYERHKMIGYQAISPKFWHKHICKC